MRRPSADRGALRACAIAAASLASAFPRDSQIRVEPPATPTVGLALVELYKATGDAEYRTQATGDRRYLGPIPRALDWLERSSIATAPGTADTHAKWYEPGSNRPLYMYRSGTGRQNERHWTEYEPGKAHFYPMGRPWTPDLRALRAEVARVSAQIRSEARAEFTALMRGGRSVRDTTGFLGAFQRIDSFNDFRVVPLTDRQAADVVASLDQRGAWVTDAEVLDREDFVHNPTHTFKGILPGVYAANIHRLLEYRSRLGQAD